MKEMNSLKKSVGNIYNKVDNNKRLLLLKMVKEEGQSLKNAAHILKINYSTAKTILRVFRLENRILRKSSYKKGRTRINSDVTTKSQSEEPAITPDNAGILIEEVKSLTSTLQKCIKEVMTNDLIIKRIQNMMGNLFPCYTN